MTRDLRIEGAATLLSSLSHGGEHAGTVGFLRREKIVGPAGITEVPVVSGNALRGLLRDHAARLWWELLDRPRLPVPVFHLLWSGGSLAKAGATHAISARQLAEVRQLIPMVSLFGGSGAGKIIEGKLRVGKLTPICAETAHLVPSEVASADLPSIWEALQIEEFTRRDDAKRDQLQPAIGAVDRDTGALLDASSESADAPAQQMRYGVETLAAGARLHWWMSLHDVTDVEIALFAAAVDAWRSAGAHLGGRSATGHGRLHLDVAQWAEQSATTVGAALDGASDDRLRTHVAEHHDDILEAMAWFA
jgi:CRISPR type IV-associated protein Csf2